MRRPWFKFYPSDWRGDVKLQACSLAARGLWIELMTIMHEARPYGHLLIDGKRPSYYRIAQLLHADYRVVKNLMAELKNTGVFTSDITGEITSRRMVRDEAKRQQKWGLKNGPWEDKLIPKCSPRYQIDKKGQAEEGRRRKQGAKTKARHRWENDLLALGAERYADLMDELAAHPELVERATKAEMREPKSGAMAVVIGVKRLREPV